MNSRATFWKSPNGCAMGRLPDPIFVKMEPSTLWVARELAGDARLYLLADPDLLFLDPKCEIIKDQRKIKVGRIALELGGKSRRVYLKRYNAFSWRYRLLSLLMRSAATNSWFGAGMLMGAGFQTGFPIAAVEYRSWGMLTKSFYLSEEIPEGKTADVHWQEELLPLKGREGYRRRRAFLRRLADLFHGLHQARLYHNDLKDANIIVSPGDGREPERFCLLDLEGLRSQGFPNRRRRVKNVVQLHRTMGRLLRQTEKLYWLKVYLGAVFYDREDKRKWIKRILAESARGDRRSQRKS